jgi:bifunctional non-homologous end joining protein LigD
MATASHRRQILLPEGTIRELMRIKRIPAGFVIPAQPVKASRPPSGADWVYEIKQDGYRIIVRRDGPTVRLYSRDAYNWTVRQAAIAAAAQRMDQGQVAPRSTAGRLCSGLMACHGLKSCTAGRLPTPQSFVPSILSKDMRILPFLDLKAALARLLRNTKAGILFNEHIAHDGPVVFAHACRLGAEGIVSKRVDGTYQSGPCRVWIKVRNPPASPCNGRGARFGTCDYSVRPSSLRSTIPMPWLPKRVAAIRRPRRAVFSSSVSASALYCTAIRR